MPLKDKNDKILTETQFQTKDNQESFTGKGNASLINYSTLNNSNTFSYQADSIRQQKHNDIDLLNLLMYIQVFIKILYYIGLIHITIY